MFVIKYRSAQTKQHQKCIIKIMIYKYGSSMMWGHHNHNLSQVQYNSQALSDESKAQWRLVILWFEILARLLSHLQYLQIPAI